MARIKTHNRKRDKKKTFICPDCGEIVYITDRSFKKCPRCNGRVIILDKEFSSMIISSPKALSFLNTFENISKARIIFDRRKNDKRKKRNITIKDKISAEKRQNAVKVIGWMTTIKKNK